MTLRLVAILLAMLVPAAATAAQTTSPDTPAPAALKSVGDYGAFGGGEMDVRPLVIMRADLPVKIIDKLRRSFARPDHQVEEILQVGTHPFVNHGNGAPCSQADDASLFSQG